MKYNNRQDFNAQAYVESIAYSKAEQAFRRSGQERADYVYKTYMENGLSLWADLRQSLSWFEAELWLRKLYGNESDAAPCKSGAKSLTDSELVPGPECWAKYTLSDYKKILVRVRDSETGRKNEKKRARQLKNAVECARIFLSVKPGIYDAERHGEWISESEFKNMLETLKEIVARYAPFPSYYAA